MFYACTKKKFLKQMFIDIIQTEPCWWYEPLFEMAAIILKMEMETIMVEETAPNQYTSRSLWTHKPSENDAGYRCCKIFVYNFEEDATQNKSWVTSFV